MDEEKEPPARSGPPPPDLVKSSPPIPPPSLPVPNVAPATPVAGPPPMSAPELPPSMKAAMKRDAEEEEEDADADGVPNLNNRLIAAVIDIAVALGLQITVYILLPSVLHRLGWLLAAGYLVTRDSLPFLGGQSVGKKAMKLKAVALDGKSLAGNWAPGVIRNLPLIILPFGLLELYVLFTREEKPERGRRLGDEWAKTKVVIASGPVAEE